MLTGTIFIYTWVLLLFYLQSKDDQALIRAGIDKFYYTLVQEVRNGKNYFH